jgi:hypothetical protein
MVVRTGELARRIGLDFATAGVTMQAYCKLAGSATHREGPRPLVVKWEQTTDLPNSSAQHASFWSGNFEKGEVIMAEEKEKAIEKDKETKKPAGGKKDELSEKDLDKASGGGHVGWIEVDKV